jgi:hypothetical protein
VPDKWATGRPSIVSKLILPVETPPITWSVKNSQRASGFPEKSSIIGFAPATSVAFKKSSRVVMIAFISQEYSLMSNIKFSHSPQDNQDHAHD